VDVAGAMVSLARRLRPEIEFRQADAERLPSGDAEFDAVVANFLILHVGRPERVAAELTRVLAPGGRLALSTWDVPARGRLIGVLADAVQQAGASPPVDLPPGPPPRRRARGGRRRRAARVGEAGRGPASPEGVDSPHADPPPQPCRAVRQRP